VGRDVFNNTALVYSTKANALQGRNFLRSALSQGDAFGGPAIYSSAVDRERLVPAPPDLTLGYRLQTAGPSARRETRLYVSGDNLLLFTYGLRPRGVVRAGDGVTRLASRGIDYLATRAPDFTPAPAFSSEPARRGRRPPRPPAAAPPPRTHGPRGTCRPSSKSAPRRRAALGAAAARRGVGAPGCTT
jgi:hypothetical protein